MLALLDQGFLDHATAVRILGQSALDKATSKTEAGKAANEAEDAASAAKRKPQTSAPKGSEDELDRILNEAKRAKMDACQRLCPCVYCAVILLSRLWVHV